MNKPDIYQDVTKKIIAVLDGETNITAQMATLICLLAGAFPSAYYWTGFYCVDPDNPSELVIGPYQGTLGCLRIPFGRGVCGTAAIQQQTQIIDNVHKVQNHIACEIASTSEIAVPVFNAKSELIAVFDVDSTQVAMFDDIDKHYLEALMARVFSNTTNH